MPIEFIGMIGVKPEGADGAAVHVIGGEIDLAWLRDFSRAHEAADFDKVLVGYTSTAAEGFVVAGYAAAHTERLALSHRAPARLRRPHPRGAQGGHPRPHHAAAGLALHIITGGSDADQAKDGDWLDHDTRYRRTDEYLTLLRRIWTEARPFDYEGEFYQVVKAFSEVKPLQKPACRSTSAAPPRPAHRSAPGTRRLHALGRAARRREAADRGGARRRRCLRPGARASASRCARSSRRPGATPGSKARRHPRAGPWPSRATARCRSPRR